MIDLLALALAGASATAAPAEHYVAVRTNAPLYEAADRSARHVFEAGGATAAHLPGAAFSARLVSRTDAWVEVETGSLGCDTDHRFHDLRVHFFVAASDLLETVGRTTTLPFSDGTALTLFPGAPLVVLPDGLVGFSWSSQRRFEFPLDPAQRVVEFAIAAEPPFSPDPDLHVRWEKLRLGATRSTRMPSALSFEVSEPARVVRAQPPGAFVEVSTSCARAVAFMAEAPVPAKASILFGTSGSGSRWLVAKDAPLSFVDGRSAGFAGPAGASFSTEVAARGSARCFTRQVYYRPDKVVPADALLTLCVDGAHVTQNPDWSPPPAKPAATPARKVASTDAAPSARRSRIPDMVPERQHIPQVDPTAAPEKQPGSPMCCAFLPIPCPWCGPPGCRPAARTPTSARTPRAAANGGSASSPSADSLPLTRAPAESSPIAPVTPKGTDKECTFDGDCGLGKVCVGSVGRRVCAEVVNRRGMPAMGVNPKPQTCRTDSDCEIGGRCESFGLDRVCVAR